MGEDMTKADIISFINKLENPEVRQVFKPVRLWKDFNTKEKSRCGYAIGSCGVELYNVPEDIVKELVLSNKLRDKYGIFK